MNAKLNFYDIYCFLIPGVILLGLLWIPFGLANVQLPLAPSAAAVLFVFFGYVAGLVLDNFATTTFINEVFVQVGSGVSIKRQRSERMLDDLAPELSNIGSRFARDRQFKARLCEKIRSLHDIDVKPVTIEPLNAQERERLEQLESKAKSEQMDDAEKKEQARLNPRKDFMSNRIVAFLQCRSTLVQHDAAVYVQQMHGMYALSRSLTATWLFAGAYHLGIGLSATIIGLSATIRGATIGSEALLAAAVVVLTLLLGTVLHLWIRKAEWKWWRLTLWILTGITLGASCGHSFLANGAAARPNWYLLLGVRPGVRFRVNLTT